MNKNFKPFPQLETERLTLKQLNQTHTKALFECQSDKRNFKYVDMTIYKKIEEAAYYIEMMNKGIDEQKWLVWAICLKDSDDIIGTISIWNLDEEKNTGELGYGIFPSHRYKGYMSECISCIEMFAKDNMLLTTLEAYTASLNKPSRLLLKKLNYTYVRTISEENKAGKLHDMAIYKKSFLN